MTAPLDPLLAGTLMREVVLERCQQEGPEPTACGVSGPEEAAGQPVGEEALGEVLGLLGGTPLPPGEGIEGVPVRPAEFRQRHAGLRVGRVAQGQDVLPAGGTELACVGSRPVRLLCRHGAILRSTDHSNTPGPRSNRARAGGRTYSSGSDSHLSKGSTPKTKKGYTDRELFFECCPDCFEEYPQERCRRPPAPHSRGNRGLTVEEAVTYRMAYGLAGDLAEGRQCFEPASLWG